MSDQPRRRAEARRESSSDARPQSTTEEPAEQSAAGQSGEATGAVEAPRVEAPAPVEQGGEQPAAAETEIERATEPGAWSALHARQVRARRPGRRGRRPAPPAEGAPEPADDERQSVIVAAAAPAEALLERSPAPVSDEAMAAAAADEEVAPARRRRRGRRGRGGRAASAAAPDERAADELPLQRGPDDEAPTAMADVAPDARAPKSEERGDGRPVGVPGEGESGGGETGDVSGEAADDEAGGDGRKRRHRGHRGGRRHRRKNDEPATDDGAAAGEVATADTDERSAAAGEVATAAGQTAVVEAAGAAVAERDVTAAAAVGDETPTATVAAGAETEPAPARRSRRRGRRRGGDDGAANADKAAEEPRPATAPPADKAGSAEGEPTEAVGRRRGGRLRRPKETGVTADLPGYKEILVSEGAGEMRVALVEDGRLAEIYIERPGKRSYAGNIYRGKVDNVLPGMDAAFVDIGLERNGFLYVDDIADPEDGEKRPRKITQMIKPGQELLVQVSKDPMGSKGARLTGQLSLAGRYLVYVPGGSGVGVSRRLPSDERDRLRDLCKSLKAKDAGLIVRTVAEGKSVEEMKNDLQFLSRLWTRLRTKAAKVKAPGLVYAEADVSLQVAPRPVQRVVLDGLVDDAEASQGARRLPREGRSRARHQGQALRRRRAPVRGARHRGADLQAARTAGAAAQRRQSGDRSRRGAHGDRRQHRPLHRRQGPRGHDHRNNLEAAREVVRQLRLRDIGGIIIIDFIDMEFARNRETVLAKLQAELETDRTKTYVVEISPLGLVEMTRQNITDGARGILTQTCPFCEGKARILSPETMAIAVERRLGDHAAVTSARALLVEVNTSVAERLVAGGRIKRLEKDTAKRFFLEGSKLLPVETFRIVAEGSLEAVESHRIPIHEDQEVTVELEYALTYSPGDAVAHVDGFQLIVLNGRRALGEKRKVRVTSLTRAGAMGVLLS